MAWLDCASLAPPLAVLEAVRALPYCDAQGCFDIALRAPPPAGDGAAMAVLTVLAVLLTLRALPWATASVADSQKA